MPKKITLLVSVALILSLAVFLHGPIPQDSRYHNFADARTVLGVPNGVNVLSNLFLILAGVAGQLSILRNSAKPVSRSLRVQYFLFFSGVFLSGVGSCWYHLDPSNASLVWDRLPMSIAFMALFASVISEAIDRKTGERLLLPLLALGLMSVGYWAWTQNAGQGDLRIYALVQFLPVLLIPLILLLYKPPAAYAAYLWLLIFLYIISKIFELLDGQIFALTGFVSGHTLKHAMAAFAAVAVIAMLNRRKNEFFQTKHKTD